jgi:hypothetical protein
MICSSVRMLDSRNCAVGICPRLGSLLIAIDVRDAFRDIVTDRVYLLCRERAELFAIVLNGIMRKLARLSLVFLSNISPRALPRE